jgi:hypothetical protein
MTHLENSGTEKFTSKSIDTASARPMPKHRGPKSAKKISKARALRDYLPVPANDYALDCKAGHLCARELLADMGAGKCSNSESEIGAMLLVMIEHRFHKKAAGVIVGFMVEISRRIPGLVG